MEFHIERIERVTEEVVRAFAGLVPQLAPERPPVTAGDVEAVIRSGVSTLFVARAADDAIVGTATLTVFPIPTGLRAWIDDVVVDASARGRGVGEALVQAAIEAARASGAPSVNLTSRPAREAANRLYRRMGFALRETNAYAYFF